jgi:hypothetical protein
MLELLEWPTKQRLLWQQHAAFNHGSLGKETDRFGVLPTPWLFQPWTHDCVTRPRAAARCPDRPRNQDAVQSADCAKLVEKRKSGLNSRGFHRRQLNRLQAIAGVLSEQATFLPIN